MSATSVPPQTIAPRETPAEPAANAVPMQWYEEEPSMENRKVETVDQGQEVLSTLTQATPLETTKTLIPNAPPPGVVNTISNDGQEVTTINGGEDKITSLADTTENHAIEEINAAHGTK